MGASTVGLLCLSTLLVGLSSCVADRRCTEEEMKTDQLQKLAYASNSFGMMLYLRLTHGSSRNIIFSPFSLSCILSMLLYGARNRTAEDLRYLLNYKPMEIPDDQVHYTFHRFLTEVIPNSSGRRPYVLSIANGLYFDRSLNVLPEYGTDVEIMYQAVVRDLDFQRDVQGAQKEINEWVRDKTRGKIKKLVDDLSPDTTMIMMNAVYFKGTWRSQFDKRKTHEETFYNGGLLTGGVKVPMMHKKGIFRYSSAFGAQALELPYKGSGVSMIIFLPHKQKGLAHFEQHFSMNKFTELYDLLYDTQVSVTLPKFKVRFGTDMSLLLGEVGIHELFVPGGADLSGITPDRNRTLFNNLLHKAAIEVNEEGTEAVGLTSVITTRMGVETVPIFKVDHPFMFTIVEQGKRSEMILFMGRVNKL